MLDIDRLHADFPAVDVYNHPPAGGHDPVIIGSLADRLAITKEKPTGDQHTRYGSAAWLYASLDEAKANLSAREYTLVPRKAYYDWDSVRSSGTVSARTLDEAFAAVTVPRGHPITIAGETRWPGNEALFSGGYEYIYAPPDTPDDIIGALVLADFRTLDSVVYRRVDWADNKKYTRRKTFAWSTKTASGTVTAPRERIEYVVDRSKYFYSDKTGADLRYALIEWARHAYQTMPTSVVLFDGVTQQTVSL